MLTPAEVRRRLRLEASGTSVVFTPVVPKPRRVRANKRWRSEAFLDAGEATFGEKGLGR